jgi:Fic family protein
MAFCPGIEPLLPNEKFHDLDDLTFELVSSAKSLAGQLNPTVRSSVGDLVRSMNCYYSNLVEGHNTLPRDIERALVQDYSFDLQRRNLQLEAVAHIQVQSMIDAGTDDPADPLSVEYICWLHREFYSRLPDELCWVSNPDTGERLRVVPGEIRLRAVAVGMHVPPSGSSVKECLERLVEGYSQPMGKFRRVIAVAASHHRLLWIHPFLDGNGRVARLLAHALLKRLDVGSSLWSVSRGLARSSAEYKALLMEADQPRQHDADRRGVLSERALLDFCRFFLRVGVDQVRFMQSILDPSNLLTRIESFCSEEAKAGRLPKQSFLVLREALLLGEVERGSVASIVNLKERAARNVISALLSRNLLSSSTPKGALRLAFPSDAVERWFPSLFPPTNLFEQITRALAEIRCLQEQEISPEISTNLKHAEELMVRAKRSFEDGKSDAARSLFYDAERMRQDAGRHLRDKSLTRS